MTCQFTSWQIKTNLTQPRLFAIFQALLGPLRVHKMLLNVLGLRLVRLRIGEVALILRNLTILPKSCCRTWAPPSWSRLCSLSKPKISSNRKEHSEQDYHPNMLAVHCYSYRRHYVQATLLGFHNNSSNDDTTLTLRIHKFWALG